MPRATFSPDGRSAPVQEDLIRLQAGDTERVTWYVDGFELTDIVDSIKLYAKIDPTDADDAATTIVLTAALSTPTLDPAAREALFTFSTANTTSLLTGRIYRIEARVTRDATQYVQTVVTGFIGAARPGATLIAPSDEATLRVLGDATVLAAAKAYVDEQLSDSFTVSDITDITTSQTGITRIGTITEGVWHGTAIDDGYLATISTAGKVANSATTATTVSTPNTIVLRDSNGDFSARTITADLVGDVVGTLTGDVFGSVVGSVTGALSGNASTATRLQTPRNINGVAFDGSADITITVSPAASSLTGTTLASNVVNSSLQTVGTLTSLSVAGAITATGGVVGNASTATSADHLTTPRTFALSGHVTASQGSDLSGNLTLATTIANSVIVDAMVSASAAIAYSKLNLSGSIVNGDIGASAAIAYSKLALALSIVNGDISSSANIADSKLATISTGGKVANSATTATSSNTASSIVARDASGNFNAGTITATFSGNLTGTVTGNVTGNITGNLTGNGTGTWTGNATSATALQTARTINGVSFDGSANITVTAAAGTLTGSTLASGVTASSLTSVGVLASPHMTSPVVDSGGLTVTAGGVTVTGNSTITGTLGGITTLTATTVAGTLSTAAQPNITSVGTLASLGVTGLITAAGGIQVTGGTAVAGSVTKNAVDGCTIVSVAGSTNDFSLYNPAIGVNIVRVPTGTTTVVLAAKLNLAGLPTSSAGLSSGDLWKNGTAVNIV